MSKQNFQTEKEGQIKFFERLALDTEVDLSNNTDGVYRGNIFEFKLQIADINRVLFQTIKYLSHLRIRGKNIPQNILLISLNDDIIYLFNSNDFLTEIEKIYNGAASRNNEQFDTEIKPQKIKYDKSDELQKLLEIVNSECYIKIHIDVFCVAGWATRYYTENPNATKIQMFEELRKPQHFKNLIYAWKGDETDFKYIMDILNDRMHRKELGAFYTPPAYCKKAIELVRKAIAQISKNHDYIILDRCAGTGNLEEFLTDKNVNDITIGELDKYLQRDFIQEYLKDKANIIDTFYSTSKMNNLLQPVVDFNNITMEQLEKYKTKYSIYNYLFDNELSHCIVNTYELKEWIVLNERIGDKVKMIIPPPIEVKNTDSLVNGADALSDNFILGRRSEKLYDMTDDYYEAITELNGYVDDTKTNIIIFENPPYRNETSQYRDTGMRKTKDDSFALTEYKKNKIKQTRDYDLSNLFIWSAKQYYLTKPNDALIVFSPVKYFKSAGLDNGLTFMDGFLLNRKYFHATESAISCVLWKNKNNEQEIFNLKVYNYYKDIKDKENDKIIRLDEIINIKKVYKFTSSIWKINNTEGKDIAYLDCKGFSVSHLAVALTNNYDTSPHKRGFYLKEYGYYIKLPLFCAKLYPQKNWYERDIYFTAADGGDRYTKDSDFLKSCFIFTCLSQRNHCLSFVSSDGKFYKNELCFDANTIASTKLKELHLTQTEKELLNIFNEILTESKQTENYNSDFTYGTYQIDKELNTRYKDVAKGIKTDRLIYNYPELNTKINALKNKLSKYYEEVIQLKLFEYELLK